MKLLTKGISQKLQAQYPKGSDFSQKVLAKIFNPQGSWTWYLMNQDPEDLDYLWGIVKGDAIEMGSFSLKDLESFRGKGFGLPLERDLHFKPLIVKELWEKLQRGEHI